VTKKLIRGVLVLAVVLFFAISLMMLSRVLGSRSPWLVLLLMFYVLAFFKVAEPLFLLRLPIALRTVQPWEISGERYRKMGVIAFGRLLRHTILRQLNTAVYLDGGRRTTGQVCRQAEAAEAAHLLAGLLVVPYIAYVAIQGRWLVGAGFVIAELVVNVLPLLHLRHTRGRLGRLASERPG
jgi:hypothetical protein